MKTPEELADWIEQNWGNKTLIQFQAEAARELNGTSYLAIRAVGKGRAILGICLTGEHEINKLQKVLPAKKPPTYDWATMTLVNFAVAAIKADGFIYDVRTSLDNRVTALALIATDPRSTSILERAFNLPP